MAITKKRKVPRMVLLQISGLKRAGQAFGQAVSVAAWKAKPCWFIITTEDRVVSTELQTAEAERMGAKTTVIQSSHMSLLSHPSEVGPSLKTPLPWSQFEQRAQTFVRGGKCPRWVFTSVSGWVAKTMNVPTPSTKLRFTKRFESM